MTSLGRVNVRDLFGRGRCRRSVRPMPCQKFSNVSALVQILNKVTKELTFGNMCLATDEMQHFQHLCHLMKDLCHLMQHLCLVSHQMQDEEEREALCCRRSSLGGARPASPPHALQEHPDGHEDALHEHAGQPASHEPHPMLTKIITLKKKSYSIVGGRRLTNLRAGGLPHTLSHRRGLGFRG